MADASLQEAEKALSKAKIRLMAAADTVFFSTVCFSLKHEFDSSVPTACTNGEYIKYGPDFFMKQSPAQQLGLLLHETFHVIFMHMLRLDQRDMRLWNIATDYVINLLITERGFQLPEGALLSQEYRGMSAEQVYGLLEQDPSRVPEDAPDHLQSPSDDGEGNGGSSGQQASQGAAGGVKTPAQLDDEAEQRLADILVRAQIQSQMAGDSAGTIPGEIQFYIDNLLKPKLPTRQLLRRHLHAIGKEDYSWRKPNRRYFPSHYLPSQWSEKLGHIAVAVDASGSVQRKEFDRFISEVAGIIRQMKPEKISLVTFDTSIRQVDEVRNIRELVNITFTGRGGTQIAPVIEWANKHKPRVMLVFTDGDFKTPALTTKVPFIWLIDRNKKFTYPFGKVVHYQS